MKQSKYINKYDYINYYTKQKGMWFFSNSEIQSALETEIKKIKNSLDKVFDDDEENESSEEDGEFDYFEYYKECLIHNKNLDEDNPLLLQGRIIDLESRKYIINKFSNIDKVFDLEKDNKRLSNEEYAKLTKKILLENDEAIIFQSVFIHNNLITKPDAIVKTGGEIILIETKGTTSAKFVHYLDLFFQMNVIESQKYLVENNYLFNYALCLIEYCLLDKNAISFELTENINLKKVVAVPTSHKKYEGLTNKELISYKNAIKKGNASLNDYASSLNIKSLMRDELSTLDANIECSKGPTRIAFNKSKNTLLKVNSNFDNAIEELINHKKNMDENSIPNFIPSARDKSEIKNCDFFAIERKLFSLQGYNLFDFSGNIANQNSEYLENAYINMPLNEILKRPLKNPNVFIELFSTSKNIMINKKPCEELIEKIQRKKVYFDFETINTPIRIINDSLPFMQVVTQCSIVKQNEEVQDVKDLECLNLIIDPQKINNQWFKEIVDNIYWDSNMKNNEIETDVSYIVYNKSFEKTRLLEISKIINEKKYTQKINSIVENLFDLADFFKLKSENPIYIVFLKELGGFYSIKKVLPLIDKYAPEIYVLTKCLNYETLEIKNGQICQNETIKRFFNIINDKDWIKIEKQMQIYCENDVRAMIAVEYFIKKLFVEN